MIDELEKTIIPHNVTLVPVNMVIDKQIFLIKAKEENKSEKKTYIRSFFLMVGNELVATNYADTKLLLTEIYMFARGNKQKKFTSIERKDGNAYLKLKLSNRHIYITEEEAITISGIYAEAKIAVNIKKWQEDELRLTPELLVDLLSKSGFLDKRG